MASTTSARPLLGDGEGRYKVQLIGNSGAGKSTTGIALAAMLGVPYVGLDTLFWTPGWGQTPAEEFKAKVREFIAQNDKGWVIDGNYDSRLGNILTKETTDIVWLDPPLIQTFYRVFVRSILRLFNLCPPCSPGCQERVGEMFFSKESILWWCLTSDRRVRREGWAKMAEMAIGSGTNVQCRKMRRLGGWGRERQEWLDSVAEMCSAEKK